VHVTTLSISSVASELWGQLDGGEYIVPQVQDLYPLCPSSQRCGLCQNFKQTTLATRLYKVRTNLYHPHLRKRSDAPGDHSTRCGCSDQKLRARGQSIEFQNAEWNSSAEVIILRTVNGGDDSDL